MAPHPHVIIIGAGIGGLSAGCYLRMNGYQTTVLEMGDMCGGVCVAWKRKGYLFDGATNWLPGALPASNLHGLLHEVMDLEKLSISYSDIFMQIQLGNERCTVYKNADRFGQELERISPEDRGHIRTLVRAIKQASKLEIPYDSAIEVMSIAEKLTFPFKNIALVKALLQWRSQTIRQFADKFKSEVLREFFVRIFPSHDYFSVFSVIMALGWMHAKGEGYPYGGSTAFMDLLEQRYRDLGGSIQFRKKVETIDIENGQVQGVQCSDGSNYACKRVVSAADGHDTIFHMLRNFSVPRSFTDRFQKWRLFPSLLQVSLGVNRKIEGEIHKFYYQFPTPLVMGDAVSDGMIVRVCNFDPVYSPEGKTAVVVHVRTEDERFWLDLREKDREAYRREKQRVADAVVEVLEAQLGDIKGNIETTDVATPATYVRYTNNWRGSYQSWAPTPEAVARQLPKIIPGLTGFYMTGHWLWPGGGMPAAIRVSRAVSQIMCRHDKRSWVLTSGSKQ